MENIHCIICGQEVLNNGIWDDVLKEAKTNPALQTELDRVIMLYYLIKDQPNNVAYHPV